MKSLSRLFPASDAAATPAAAVARIAVMLMFAVLFVVAGVSGYHVGASAAAAEKTAERTR